MLTMQVAKTYPAGRPGASRALISWQYACPNFQRHATAWLPRGFQPPSCLGAHTQRCIGGLNIRNCVLPGCPLPVRRPMAWARASHGPKQQDAYGAPLHLQTPPVFFFSLRGRRIRCYLAYGRQSVHHCPAQTQSYKISIARCGRHVRLERIRKPEGVQLKV